MLVEVGAGQAEDVAQMLRATGRFGKPHASCDPAGITRVVGAEIKEII